MKRSSYLSRALSISIYLLMLMQIIPGLAAAQGAGVQGEQPGAPVPARESDPVESAKRFFAAGQYRESISALKAAYAAAPRPRLYYNIAVCYVKLKEPFEAITYFRLYQSEAPDLSPEQQSAITAQINELRRQLADAKVSPTIVPTPSPGVLSTPSTPKPRPPSPIDQTRPSTQKEAAAQKESADRYDAARDLYAAGRYEEAIVELKTSYALAPRPKLYFNVAMCHMKLNQPFEAIAYFQRYLGEAPEVTTEKAAEINGYVAELRTRLHLTKDKSTASIAAPGPVLEKQRDISNPHQVPIYKRGWFWAVTIGSIAVVATAIAVPVALSQKKSLCDGVDACAMPSLP